MKKILITVALLATLGTFATSCQKEVAQSTATEYACSEHTFVYRIDNKEYYADIPNGDEWYSFLTRMVAISREGYRVTVRLAGSSTQTAASKEKVVFETDNPEEAAKWAEMMLEAGYEVTVYFDEQTGVYTLTAIN